MSSNTYGERLIGLGRSWKSCSRGLPRTHYEKDRGSAQMAERNLHKLLLGSVALIALAIPLGARAADVSTLAPYKAPPLTPFFSWTGFYVGANLGGGYAPGSISDSLLGLSVGTTAAVNGMPLGFVGGGEAGFNYQFGNFVVGIEGDFDGTSMGAAPPGVPTPIAIVQVSTSTSWVSTLAGRFGVASGNVLFYGKAGGGWIDSTATITNLNLSVNGSFSASNLASGWLAGGGFEWAFAPDWSAKLEYNYLALPTWSFASPMFGPLDTFTVHRSNIEMVKAGLNYRFIFY
jgi:outer membrane immunogenic protein